METTGVPEAGVIARTIAFDGCLNFRDLGGYATGDGRMVLWRRLFRSDSLHRMSAADVTLLIDELGVVTVIDLRTKAERDRGGPVPATASAGVRSLHVPMIDGLFADRAERRPLPESLDMGEGYVAMLESAGEHVAELLRLLSGDVYPAVFFCAAGKDRTGVLAALVLALLGVHEDDVVADYAITDAVAPAIIERADRELYEHAWASLPPEARGAPPRVMRSMLAAMARRHGSVASFVASLGVEPDVVAGLRARLLSSPNDRSEMA
jgi:protein-tyrosine phosphatase